MSTQTDACEPVVRQTAKQPAVSVGTNALAVPAVASSTASGVLIGGAFGGGFGAVAGGLVGLTVGVFAAMDSN